jgi:hypothetical protein
MIGNSFKSSIGRLVLGALVPAAALAAVAAVPAEAQTKENPVASARPAQPVASTRPAPAVRNRSPSGVSRHHYPVRPVPPGWNHDNHWNDWDDWRDEWDDYRDRQVVRDVFRTIGRVIAVGTIVNALEPECKQVTVNSLLYFQCGENWFQPQYSGSSVQYVAVAKPA